MVTGVFAVVVLSDSVGAVGAVDCRSCRSCRSAVGVLSDFAVVLSYRGSINKVTYSLPRASERASPRKFQGFPRLLDGCLGPLSQPASFQY